ncbi:MAG TPA: hypothetical protein VIH29_03505 [Gallionella sp.]
MRCGIGIGDALLPDDGFDSINDTGTRTGRAEIQAEVIDGDMSFNG